MKIGFLTSEFPHPKTGVSGGIGTSIMNLSKGLATLGNDVSILVYGQKEDEVFTDDGITFYRIKNTKIKGLSRFLTQKKIESLINSLVKQAKIEIIEASDWTGITSYIRPKCPLVVRLHGSDTYFCYLDKRPVKRINKFHEKRALQKADALISVSKYTADVTKQLFGLDRDFIVIPNCVDLAKFEQIESQKEVTDPVILYFGTLIRKKGLLEIPLIFNFVWKHNKNARLVLVGRDSSDIISGNSSTWEMMQPLFETEALKQVTYIGSVPYDQIKHIINQAAVCVFPTFAEALPVSWIESMAMQKAIVASNIGWAEEVIDDGENGFLVHPCAHELYADRILTLLNDEELRFSFGVNARKKAEEKFNIDTVAKLSLAFYKNLI